MTTPPARSVHENRMRLRVLQREADAGLRSTMALFDVPCRSGCAACCLQRVYVFAEEASCIIDHLRRTRGLQALAELGERCREHVTQVGHLDGYEHFDRRVPCPLLDRSTQRCTAYDVRPYACRLYLVVSSPERCAESSRAEIHQLDTPALRTAYFHGVLDLRGSDDLAALTDSMVQLSEALLEALGRLPA